MGTLRRCGISALVNVINIEDFIRDFNKEAIIVDGYSINLFHEFVT